MSEKNVVLEAIKSRRSIRKYRPEQIRDEELEAILEAGRYAPSACNEQPWHFTVIQNADILQKINSLVLRGMQQSDLEWHRKMAANSAFRVTYDSPTLIIVSGRVDATAPAVDCAAAMENMMLAAQSLGIGSVWLGLVRFFFADSVHVAELGIPAGYKPFYGASFGYAFAGTSAVAPKRNGDVVTLIK
jgi:nitroreductase